MSTPYSDVRAPRLNGATATSGLSSDDRWLEPALDAVERRLELEDLRGWDPYDALCSPLFALPVLRSNRALRYAAQQAVKRAPWNLRPVLRIPKQLNPVSIGLYLQGQAVRGQTHRADRERRLDKAR